jgi:hypothetical protein
MRSHRRTIRHIRRLAIVLVAVTALVPAGAGASPVHRRYQDPAGAYGAALNAPTKLGDTPADFPGVSGSADATAPIVLVRPERTIVHEANQALPIALSSAALALVLMGAAFVLVRARVQRRHVVRASH